MQARAHIWVEGMVQGVFFRSTLRSMSIVRGVNGWVRNTKDGRVEAIFEGDKDRIKEVIDFCHNGPVGAEVEKVRVEWEPLEGNFIKMEILL